MRRFVREAFIVMVGPFEAELKMLSFNNPAVSSPGAACRDVSEVGALAERYREVRALTESLLEGLNAEDCQVQSMPDASPIKWHLAHTTWFFETFLLAKDSGWRPVDASYAQLFNSYYNSVGSMHPRPERGLLTRPSLAAVLDYRARIDAAVLERLNAGPVAADAASLSILELGLNHEQQHQELMLTDLKHLLSRNPLQPAYRRLVPPLPSSAASLRWIACSGGLTDIGHDGNGFCFDNEQPRHRQWLEPYALGSRLITNGEYRDFMHEGGYRNPLLWLSDGWAMVQAEGWSRPLYWSENGEQVFTLGGLREWQAEEPVCHLSYYEADAFARWAGARLPTEAEWEAAAAQHRIRGHFLENGLLHPAVEADDEPRWFGNVWQWTRSPYTPYPGYQPGDGALGEYNGKFMCNQLVLRGGSCASSASHLRSTYRNFFYPQARWQFTGLRLAKDLG